MKLQVIENQSQKYRAEAHLNLVYIESKQHLRKKLYKKAFLMVDRFYLQYNLRNQLKVEDRISLRRRSLYTLTKILFKLILKELGQEPKAESIITRLLILLQDHHTDLSFLLESKNTSNTIHKDTLEYLCSQQKMNDLNPSPFQISHVKKISLSFHISWFFSQITRTLRILGMAYRNFSPNLAAHFFQMSHKVSQNLVSNTVNFSNQWEMILENSKSQLMMSCVYFEWNWQDFLKESSQFDLRLQYQIENIIGNTQLIQKPKEKHKMKKGIKMLVAQQFLQVYISMEQADIQQVHESLTLSEWLIQSFIQTYHDELKGFILNFCRSLIPKYQASLMFAQEANLMLLKYFGPQHYMFSKLQIKNERSIDKKIQKEGTMNYFNTQMYDRHETKVLNEQGIVFHQKQEFGEEQNQLNSQQQQKVFWEFHSMLDDDKQKTPQELLKRRSLFMNDLTTLDQISGFLTKGSSMNTPRVQAHTTRRQSTLPTDRHQSSSILTTDKYFKSQLTTKTIQQVDTFDYQNLKSDDKYFINFDPTHFNKSPQNLVETGRASIDLDYIMKRRVFSIMAKQDVFKRQNMYHQQMKLRVQEDFNKVLSDNNFDKKEFDFAHKMLLFKKFKDKITKKPEGDKSKLTLRQQLKREEYDLKHIQIFTKNLANNSFNSSDSSDLSFEKPGVKLNPLQKWRMIIFKHKKIFDLANLRIKLKLRNKDHIHLAEGKNLLRCIALAQLKNNPKVVQNETKLIKRNHQKSSDLFMKVIKQHEKDGIQVNQQYTKQRNSVIAHQSSSTDFKMTTKFNDLFESTKHQSAHLQEITSFADLVQVSMARQKQKKKSLYMKSNK